MMRTKSFSCARAPLLAGWTVAFCATGALVGCASAQYPNPGPASQSEAPVPGISPFRPRFSADAAVQPGVGGAPEVRIDYRLARSELLFERTPTGFRGAYEIRVIFYASKGNKVVAGDAFTREVKVARYSETNVQGEDIADHAVFRVPAGKYAINIALTDLTAERISSTVLTVDVPSVPEGQIWFTDLSMGLIRSDSATAPGAARSPAPNPSRRYGENLPQLAVTGEIVDNRPAGSPDSIYRISYEILSDAQASVARGDTSFARRGARTPFLFRPRVMALDPGTYRFIVELTGPITPAKGRKKPVPVRREKSFTVEQTAASIALDPRGSIEVLRYVATKEEQGEMDALKLPEERRAFWETFWKRRDPSPESAQNEAMEEFYRRVQYANQHFGAGVPGWRTDMGKTYIIEGQPDEVVRDPFRVDGPPREIWYYYKERRTYVFVDKDGFGRYELDFQRDQ